MTPYIPPEVKLILAGIRVYCSLFPEQKDKGNDGNLYPERYSKLNIGEISHISHWGLGHYDAPHLTYVEWHDDLTAWLDDGSTYPASADVLLQNEEFGDNLQVACINALKAAQVLQTLDDFLWGNTPYMTPWEGYLPRGTSIQVYKASGIGSMHGLPKWIAIMEGSNKFPHIIAKEISQEHSVEQFLMAISHFTGKMRKAP